MSVYGASATRDRQAWLFGLTGPQFVLVLAAGFPTWMAIAMQKWLPLLVLLPAWGVVGLLVCLPIRGHSASGTCNASASATSKLRRRRFAMRGVENGRPALAHSATRSNSSLPIT